MANAHASPVALRRVKARLLVKAARTTRMTLARKKAVNTAMEMGDGAGATNQRYAATAPNNEAATSDSAAAKNASALDGERRKDSTMDVQRPS